MPKLPPYDPEFAEQLEREGIKPSDAANIAATEMDGLNEEGGYANGQQTACHILGYPEPGQPMPPDTRQAITNQRIQEIPSLIAAVVRALELNQNDVLYLYPDTLQDYLDLLEQENGENQYDQLIQEIKNLLEQIRQRLNI